MQATDEKTADAAAVVEFKLTDDQRKRLAVRERARLRRVAWMLSFVEERDRIFERWLSEVERLLDRHPDHDDAFAAWTNGYSAAEYAAELKARGARR